MDSTSSRVPHKYRLFGIVSDIYIYTQEMDDSISEFDDSVWGGAVESMTIQEKGKAVVRFKGGIEIEVE